MPSSADLNQPNPLSSAIPVDAVLQALGASSTGLDPNLTGLDLLSADDLLVYLESRLSALSYEATSQEKASRAYRRSAAVHATRCLQGRTTSTP